MIDDDRNMNKNKKKGNNKGCCANTPGDCGGGEGGNGGGDGAGGGGAAGARERAKQGTFAQQIVGKGGGGSGGAGGERTCTSKQSGTTPENREETTLATTNHLSRFSSAGSNSSSQSQEMEQRHAGAAAAALTPPLRNNTSNSSTANSSSSSTKKRVPCGNAWGVTTTAGVVGSGGGGGGSSRLTTTTTTTTTAQITTAAAAAMNRQREQQNTITVVGLGINNKAGCAAVPVNSGSTEILSKKSESVIIKSTDPKSSVCSNSGSDSRGKEDYSSRSSIHHADSRESAELNSNGSNSSSSKGGGGVRTCWKRAAATEVKEGSRAYAAAASRALGSAADAKRITAEAGGRAAAVTTTDEKEAVVCPGRYYAASGGSGQARSDLLLSSSQTVEEQRKNEDKITSSSTTTTTKAEQQQLQQQAVELLQIQKGLQEKVNTEKKVKGAANINSREGDDEKATAPLLYSALLNLQQSMSLDNAENTPPPPSLRGRTHSDASSNSGVSSTKQVHTTTRKPCELFRSKTSTDHTVEGGRHRAAGPATEGGGGGERQLLHSYSMGATPTRAQRQNRLRQVSSLKASSPEDIEENQPMRTSALALQSALVSLLQVQERHSGGGNGRVSKPVMPRRNLMCTSLLRTGVCTNSERCNYAHNLLELQKKLELRKTSLCKYWLKGKCENDDCNFAHGEHELQSTDGVYKTTICKYWRQGACYSGSSCRHAHGEEDLRPERLPPHLERKRLQQLQKAPWRSSSFTPNTSSGSGGGATAMTSALFDRTRSAVDMDRRPGRSGEMKAGASGSVVVAKSRTSGDLSHLFAPLHRQERNEDDSIVPGGDHPAAVAAAARIFAEAAAAGGSGGTGPADNALLREMLQKSFFATQNKSRVVVDAAVTDDTPNTLSSATATVLSRAGIMLKNIEQKDVASPPPLPPPSLARNVKQIPSMMMMTGCENTLQDNSTASRLLENNISSLLEGVASENGLLAQVVHLLQQQQQQQQQHREEQAAAGSIGAHGVSTLNTAAAVVEQQRRTAARISKANTTADLMEAAAAIVASAGEETKRKTATGSSPSSSSLSSEVIFPTQDEGLLQKLRLLLPGIGSNHSDKQQHGGSNERESADASITPRATGRNTMNSNRDEADVLSTLLGLLGMNNTSGKRQQWNNTEDDKNNSSSLRMSPYSNTGVFPLGLGDVSGSLRCDQSRDGGTSCSTGGDHSSRDIMMRGSGGVVGSTNSTPSGDLQAILNCGDILCGGTGASSKNIGELSSLRLPEQLIEQSTSASGGSPIVIPDIACLTKTAEQDGTAVLPGLSIHPSLLLTRCKGSGSDVFHAAAAAANNIMTTPEGGGMTDDIMPVCERSGSGLEQKKLGMSTPKGEEDGIHDGYRTYRGNLFNNSSGSSSRNNSSVLSGEVVVDGSSKNVEDEDEKKRNRFSGIAGCGEKGGLCESGMISTSSSSTRSEYYYPGGGTPAATAVVAGIGTASNGTGTGGPSNFVSMAGGGSNARGGGGLGTGLVGGTAFSEDDSRFSSACWRVTGAEAATLLLNNQRNSSTHQLEAPLNRSPTLPSMSDYVVDEGRASRGGCTPERDQESVAVVSHSSCQQQQQLQQQRHVLLGGPRTTTGENGNIEENGSRLWSSSPGFILPEFLRKGTQEGCRASHFDEENASPSSGGGGGGGGLLLPSATAAALVSTTTGSGATVITRDATCVRRPKGGEQQELGDRSSLWEQTGLVEPKSSVVVNRSRFDEPVSDTHQVPPATKTVFENLMLGELSDYSFVTALPHVTAEEKLRQSTSKVVMKPLHENGELLEDDAIYTTAINRERDGGVCNIPNRQALPYGVNSGPPPRSSSTTDSFGLIPHLDDASLAAAASRCRSTIGGVRSLSGGALSSSSRGSVECPSPSGLSDTSNSGKAERRLFDVGSSSSTIFPP